MGRIVVSYRMTRNDRSMSYTVYAHNRGKASGNSSVCSFFPSGDQTRSKQGNLIELSMAAMLASFNSLISVTPLFIF